jgi:hypothetical protein
MIQAVIDPNMRLPIFEAVATRGTGVFETLKAVSRQVLLRVAAG